MGTPDRDIKMAKALIDVAAEAGCDAVKFQTYRPETVYVENAGSSDYLSRAGIQESIRDIFADLSMPYDMIPELAAYSRSRKILFMSSFFSLKDAEKVDPYVAIHKIASYETSHLRLLEFAGASGKPLILSTGASTETEVARAIKIFRKAGGQDLCLMQCTARYPAPLDTLNLAVIPKMSDKFQVPVGLSDHSEDPTLGPAAAVALGACAVEKHFTLDKRLPGPDHAFAVTPGELARMVGAIRKVEKALGTGVKTILPAEEELRAFAHRGLQAVKEIKKGDVLHEGLNFDILRPGHQQQGLNPCDIEKIEGRNASRDIPIGDGILEDDVEGA